MMFCLGMETVISIGIQIRIQDIVFRVLKWICEEGHDRVKQTPKYDR